MWPFRKAVTPQSKKSASFYFTLGGGKAGLNGAAYDRIATEGYEQCVIAFDCINRIATSIASVEWHLYRKGKNGKLTKIDSHPLLDLIDTPNASQSGPEFRRWLVSYHRLAGNAYILGNGLDGSVIRTKTPSELMLLQPGKVKVEPGKTFPLAYVYKPDASNTHTYPVDQVSGRSAVLHLKTFNPLNPWYGLPPLSAAALPADIHTGGQKWNKALIENGARPSGALVVESADGKPSTLSEDQYQRVKEMIDEQFSGVSNSGRPMLLEGGLNWKEMSLNPKDMDFLEGKHSAARDIALAFGVPPMLLGIPGDNTYSNMQEAKLAFWTDTLLPLLSSILESFNHWLVPLYGEDLFLWYDPEQIDALEPLRKQKADRINASSYMTINEKRRAMSLDDIENGDTILVPTTSMSLEMATDAGLAEPGSPASQQSSGQETP
jgi:HK97 family phage portal protein